MNISTKLSTGIAVLLGMLFIIPLAAFALDTYVLSQTVANSYTINMANGSKYAAQSFTFNSSTAVKSYVWSDSTGCTILNSAGTNVTGAYTGPTSIGGGLYRCTLSATTTYSAGTYYLQSGSNGTYHSVGSASDVYGGGSAGEMSNLSPGTFDSSEVFAGGMHDYAFAFCADDGCDMYGGISGTQIVAVSPAGGSLVATSSLATLGATVYIAPSDYVSGMYVEFIYGPYSNAMYSVASPASLATTIDLPINASGGQVISTMTQFVTQGEYSLQTMIKSPSHWYDTILNTYGLTQYTTNNIVSSSTTFTAGALSQYDIFQASTTAALTTYLASSTLDWSSCNTFTSFNLRDCLSILFVPQPAAIASVLTDFRSGFLSRAPLGYVTNFIGIISTNNPALYATYPLPDLKFTVPHQLVGYDSTVDLTPWTHMLGSGSILDTTTTYDGKTLRQVTEPYWDDLVLICFIVATAGSIIKFRYEYV